MAAPFIVINTYVIKEGKLEDFRQFLRELFTVPSRRTSRVCAPSTPRSTRTAPRRVHPPRSNPGNGGLNPRQEGRACRTTNTGQEKPHLLLTLHFALDSRLGELDGKRG